MTWTFNPEHLGADGVEGHLAAVRSLVGDTEESDPLITDEEIKWIVARWLPMEGTVEYCAAQVAEQIASKYAREVSHSADGVSINLGQLAQQFRDLAASLREQHKRLAAAGAAPDAGGMLLGDQRDESLRNFSFGTQMHDNLEAGQQDHGSRSVPLTQEQGLY